MSTWAARLSGRTATATATTTTTTSSSERCSSISDNKDDNRHVSSHSDDDVTHTMVLRQACASASCDAVQYARTTASSSLRHGGWRGRDGGRGSAQRSRRASTSTSATHDAVALRLPGDCWAHVLSFLSYVEVCRVLRVCAALHACLARRESVWRTQLHYFHADMRDMRGGGGLLTTTFALPALARGDSYVRLRCERQLYGVDAQREWHFRDVAAHEDKDVVTGMFTVPLQLPDGDASSSSSSSSTTATATTSTSTSASAHSNEDDAAWRLVILRPQRDDDNDDAQQQQHDNDDDDDDEAALRRAIVLSLCDVPSSTSSLHRCNNAHDDDARRVRHGAPTRSPRTLREHELMTLVDCLNHGNAALSRTAVCDVTAHEDVRFVRALACTLAAAMRRRAHTHSSSGGDHDYEARRRGGGSGGAASSARPSPPRTTPCMLCRFRGQLLEVTRGEAHDVCASLLRRPDVLHDLELFDGYADDHDSTTTQRRRHNNNNDDDDDDVSARLRATTRFFLAPELCTCGTMGLIVADAVRVLILVEDEATEWSKHRGSADVRWLQRRRARAAAAMANGSSSHHHHHHHGEAASTTMMSTLQRALLRDESTLAIGGGGVARLTSSGRLVLPGRGVNAQVSPPDG